MAVKNEAGAPRAAATDGMHDVVVTRKANGQRLVRRRLVPELARDADLVGRWLEVAALNARLVHPACVRVAEWGTDALGPFVTSCVHAGAPLRVVFQRERAAAQRIALSVLVARMLLEACEAARAVDPRLVHLDLDPDCVRVQPSGELVVPEFGLWGALSPGERAQRRRASGRAHYASPELINERPIDGRSDVFAIGVILWELASGRHPFAGPTHSASPLAVADGPRPPLGDLAPALSVALRDVLEGMLAADADDRFQSPEAARHALQHALPSVDGAHARLAALVADARRARPRSPARTPSMNEVQTTRSARPARSACTRLGFAASTMVDDVKRPAMPSRPAPADTNASMPAPVAPPLRGSVVSNPPARISALPLPAIGAWACADRFVRSSRPPSGTPPWRDPSATVFRQTLDFTVPAAAPERTPQHDRIMWGLLFGLPILLIVYFSCRLAL